MQDHELTAWLGPVELDEEQMTTLRREVARIEAAYPDPDEQDTRDVAMSAAVQYLLEDTTPREVGGRLARAHAEVHDARVAMRTTARLMIDAGVTEVDAARDLGVDRMTIRKAVGKL